MKKSALEPKGGPNAVGYYIYKELESRGITYISFIEDEDRKDEDRKDEGKSSCKSRLYLWLQQIARVINRYKRFSKAFKRGGFSIVDLNRYDVVHFHKTVDMYECRRSLESYKGIVILTSHSPVPLSKEFYDEQLTSFEKKYLRRFYSKLIRMDEYAFNRADFIHFPCEEAEEPYYNNWKGYEQIARLRAEHYVYIPTGIPPVSPKRSRAEVRRELSIPENDFYVSYVGRHNSVKGYDILKAIGQKVISANTWVVVAGKEYPMQGLNNSHWIEVGWTNDAHSYIAASDVFVLPNRETYFDIVMLEVLSLGRIVVASRTGGNRYFEKFGPCGIFLYDTVDEAVDIINRIQQMSQEERKVLGELNKKLFGENFTAEIFVNRYCRFVSGLK